MSSNNSPVGYFCYPARGAYYPPKEAALDQAITHVLCSYLDIGNIDMTAIPCGDNFVPLSVRWPLSGWTTPNVFCHNMSHDRLYITDIAGTGKKYHLKPWGGSFVVTCLPSTIQIWNP